MTVDGDQVELRRLPAARGAAPVIHPDVQGFWEALDRGRLSLQRCTECATLRFPVAPNCHQCLSEEHQWEAISPHGTVDVAVEARAAVSALPASGVSLPEPWRGMTPYFSGNVDMTAGVRLPGRIICRCGVAATRGTPVEAVLLETESGATVYGFVHDCE